MTKSPLAIIDLDSFPKLLEFESTNLVRNITLLHSVQHFVNQHFKEFMKIRKQTIPEIKFNPQELILMKKLFEQKTKYEEVKDNLYDLAIKVSQINQEETDIPKFIREMSLTYLVSNFEDFLVKCLLHYYQLEPRALIINSTNKTKKDQAKKEPEKMISYSDILLCESLDEIITKIIQKELDILMRNDIVNIIKYIEKLFSTKLSNYYDFTEFKEIFYRRNCIVHNKGYSNPEYNFKNNVNEKTSIYLDTNDDYLQKSFKRIIVYSEKIQIVILKKVTECSHK